jgi:hypothetical protein
METPLECESHGRAGVVATFHDAPVHEVVLREQAAPLDNVDDLGRCTEPIVECFRGTREIKRLVLVQAWRPGEVTSPKEDGVHQHRMTLFFYGTTKGIAQALHV